MGGYSLKKYASGPINWHKLASPDFWQVEFGEVQMGNWKMKPSTNMAMADSGTSLNMMPDEDYYKIYNQFINGSFDCHTSPTTLDVCKCRNQTDYEKVPDLNFKIGDTPYTITRDQWFERDGSTCVVKFMHAPNRKVWILGLNFFTNYYTVFDYHNEQIGFAPSKLFNGKPSSKFMQWVKQTDNASKAKLMNLQSSASDIINGAVQVSAE